jgi:hypothetical protein
MTFNLSKGKIRKALKENSKSPWSLHIGSFWKVHFINPPEVRGQVVGFTEIGKGTINNKL